MSADASTSTAAAMPADSAAVSSASASAASHHPPSALDAIAAALPASLNDDPDQVHPTYTKEEAEAAGAAVGQNIREGIKHAVSSIGQAVGIGCPSPAVNAPVDAATQTASGAAISGSATEVPHSTV